MLENMLTMLVSWTVASVIMGWLVARWFLHQRRQDEKERQEDGRTKVERR